MFGLMLESLGRTRVGALEFCYGFVTQCYGLVMEKMAASRQCYTVTAKVAFIGSTGLP